MSHHSKHPMDPKFAARVEKQEHRDHRVEHVFRRILHFLERVVAALTLIALVAALAFEVYQCVVDISYIANIGNYLHISAAYRKTEALHCFITKNSYSCIIKEAYTCG